MKTFSLRIRVFLLASSVVFVACHVEGATYSRNGNTTNSLNLGANWTPSGPPTSATADTANFGVAGSSGSTLSQTAALNIQHISFNGPTGFTWNSTANLMMGDVDSSPRGSLTNISGATQILNFTGATLGVNGPIGGTDNFVINAPFAPGRGVNVNNTYANFVSSANVYMNVDSSIVAGGNVNGGAWINGSNTNTRNISYFEGSGKVYLGNLGIAYRGNFVLDGDSNNGGTNGMTVILTHNNSLGAGNVNNAAVHLGWVGDRGGNGTLQFGTLDLLNNPIPNISVGRYTMNLAPRTDIFANDPHILNASGNNTFTTFADWNTLTGSSGGNWNIQSDAGKITFAGAAAKVYNTEQVPVTLQLMGAGDGQFDSGLAVWNAAPALGIVKKGTGTWTFTNIPVAGPGVSATPGAGVVSIFTGTLTSTEGILALSGSTTLSGATAVDIRSGAFFDVSGLTGGNLTLNSANLMTKGAGTITGSLTAGTSNAIAPGDSGIGTLTISNALTLNGGGSLEMELTSTPTNMAGVNDKVAVGGNLTLAGSTAVNMTPVNGYLGAGTYQLLTYVGSLTGTGANLTKNLADTHRQTLSFGTGTPGQVNLVVTGDVGNLTWKGGVNGDIWVDGDADANSVNWNGSTDNHFYHGDNVTFGSSPMTFTPDIVGVVSPANITFANGLGANYSVSGGTISSTYGTLAYTGAGNATLSNSATSVKTLSMTGSGTLDIAAGNFTVTNSVALSGTGTIRFSNTGGLISLPSTVAVNSGTLAINRTDDLIGVTSVANKFTGGGTVRKENINTVEASGDNSGFTGTAVVAAGTLRITNPLSLTNTTVENNATLHFDVGTGGLTTFGGGTKAISINGTGAAGSLGALVVAPTTGTAAVNAHIGALTLTGDATIATAHAGGTGLALLYVEGPITGNVNNPYNLKLNVDPSGGASEVDFVNNGVVTGLNNITVSGGGSLYVGRNTDLGASGKLILGDGTTNGKLGVYIGTQANALTVPSINKPIEVAAVTTGGLENYLNGASVFNSPIEINGAGFDVVNYTSTNSTTTSVTFNGPITGTGGLGLHLDAAGTSSRRGAVFLTNDGNTYSGPTTIGGGGGINATAAANDRTSVYIGDGGSTGSIGTGPITITAPANDYATLQLNRTGTYTVGANIDMAGTVERAYVASIKAGGNPTLSGVISGTLGFLEQIEGNMTLTGNNTFGSTVAAFKGRLTVGHDNALGAAGTNNVGYTQLYGSIYTGAPGDDTSSLALSHPTGINLAEKTVFMIPHATNSLPQIVNVQGNNTINAMLTTDAIMDATSKHYVFQVDAGSSLTISSTGGVRQDLVGDAFLTLRGAGTGQIDAPIMQLGTNWFNGGAVGDGSGTQNVFHLFKEDAGQWTLTNATNNYTGNTTVNGGTLSITNQFLPNAADVFLTAGSALNLSFSGLPDTVDALFINAAPQATGTWGAIGSGAAHETALITGTGMLLVSTTSALPGDFNLDGKVNAADYVLWRKNNINGAQGYIDWRANFGNPPGSGAGLDGGAVPEPATCGLLLCAVIGLMSCRRRGAIG